MATRPKMGLYIEVVMHGHGMHEIIGQWNVPVTKADHLQKLIEKHPELFKVRKG